MRIAPDHQMGRADSPHNSCTESRDTRGPREKVLEKPCWMDRSILSEGMRPPAQGPLRRNPGGVRTKEGQRLSESMKRRVHRVAEEEAAPSSEGHEG
jgi:hypothetical protein